MPGPGNDELLGSFAQLFRSAGALAVAKNIESEEVLGWMRGLGYDEGQGLHLGRPSWAADLVPLLVRS